MQANAMTATAVQQADAAALPRRLPWTRQFALQLRLLYSDYRDDIIQLVLFSMLMPLGMIWLMGNYISMQGSGNEWFLGGNIIMSTGFGTAMFTAFRVGFLRLMHQIDYYGTLPVHRSAFLAALFCLSQITTVPGLAVILAAGGWYLGVPFARIVTGLPVIFLTSVSLAFLGAAIGSFARKMSELNIYTNLMIFLVMFLSPVMVPMSALPLPLRLTSYLLPTGQAAMALTDAFTGQYGPRFWLLTGALCVWLLITGIFTVTRLNWQND